MDPSARQPAGDRSCVGHDPQAALDAQAERYRSLFDNIADAVFATDLDFRILSWNPAATRMYGWKADEVIGREAGEILRPQYLAQPLERVVEVLRTTGEWRDEVIHHHRDGTELPVIASAAQITDEAGKVIGYVSINYDITARKRLENERENALFKTRTLLGTMATGVIVTDPGGCIAEVNPAAEQITGIPAAELCGRWIDDTTWPVFRGDGSPIPVQEFAAVRARQEQRPIEGFEFVFRSAARGDRWLSLNAAPVSAAGIGLVITFNDVTERKQAEAALQESEQRFVTVIRNSPIAIGISRLADGQFLEVNDAFVQLYGYSREEIIGHTSAERGLWHSGDRDAVIRNLCEQKGRQVVEMQARRKDGEVRDLLASIELILLGGEMCMVGFLSDITERKRMETALRESEARFRTVVQDQTEIISRFRSDGTILFVNDVFCRFFGKTCEELVGKRWQPNAAESDIPAIEARLGSLSPTNPVVTIENRVHAAGGGLRWMQFVNRAFFDPSGRLLEIQAVGRDITERKLLEADRSAALARLAVVEEQERLRLSRELHDQTAQRLVALAVDLKNLEIHLAAGRQDPTQVQSLRRSVDELQQQVRQMAWDWRAGSPVEGNLGNALREFVEEWSERTGVPVDFDARGFDQHHLPVALESALYRVAREALTNVEKHAHAEQVAVLLARDEALVRLTVEDDGKGFDPDTATHPIKGGQRLGLLGMRERVALVGGTFLIESSPDSGSTILVRIPIPPQGKP